MVAAKSAAPLDSGFWKLSLAFVSLPSPAEDRRQHEPAGTQPFFFKGVGHRSGSRSSRLCGWLLCHEILLSLFLYLLRVVRLFGHRCPNEERTYSSLEGFRKINID